MNRFKTPILSFIVSVFLFIGAVPGFSQTVSLTILHTNDTHGYLLPFSYPAQSDPCLTSPGLPERKEIGGMARRVTLIKQIRNELQSKGAKVWLIDAGDFSDGTSFSTEFHGEADIAAMNAAGYDFAVFGNHDFNHTLAHTLKLIDQARYPILCSNVTFAVDKKPLTPLYRIESVGSVRVGIFGLVAKETASYRAMREGLGVAGVITTARAIVKKLRSKADIIVLISHCGKETDEKIAQTASGIDVIIGGHSHSRLPFGEFIRQPDALQSERMNGTVIVQAHQWGGELGQCDLVFEKDTSGAWRLKQYKARLLPITTAIRPDEKTAEQIKQYADRLPARYSEVIGNAAADFSRRCSDAAESNLVTDAVRETFGTEIELENLGGVRAPLLKGKITRGDLVRLDPFDNTVVTFKITGKKLREILKKYAPAVSGLRYRLEKDELIEVSVNGQPLQNDRVYTGATNSHFAERALKGIAVQDTGRQRLDVLIEYIRKNGTIHPAYDGRRIVVNEKTD
ncbi:MAG: bifunctional metallophosphatase/5'-nucleotidase [Desulfobacteraceae bacterium]|nr:MAG: bifunctional metallophosphatase/5'-nucleotidase [Desulfobacteraceae bacterium]